MRTEDIYAPQKYLEVQSDTWGHLAPEPRVVYSGEMVFALTAYGEHTIIQSNFKGLPDSPWLFNDMLMYACDTARVSGAVYRWQGTYQKYKNGNHKFSGSLKIVVPGKVVNSFLNREED